MAIFHLHGPRCFKDGVPSSMVGFEPSFPWHRPGNGCSSLHCHGAAISVPVELSWREPWGHLFSFLVSFLQTFFGYPKVAGRFGSRKGTGCLKPFRIKQLLNTLFLCQHFQTFFNSLGGLIISLAMIAMRWTPHLLERYFSSWLTIGNYWDPIFGSHRLCMREQRLHLIERDCDRTSTGSNACIHA